jgi:hypothetical protein
MKQFSWATLLLFITSAATSQAYKTYEYVQPASSNFNPRLQIKQLVGQNSTTVTTVKVNNDNGKVLATTKLTDGWVISNQPAYTIPAQNGEKRIFLKTKPTADSSGLWVVRIVKEFINNVEQNTARHDSTLFTTYKDPKKLSSYTSFRINFIALEAKNKGDKDTDLPTNTKDAEKNRLNRQKNAELEKSFEMTGYLYFVMNTSNRPKLKLVDFSINGSNHPHNSKALIVGTPHTINMSITHGINNTPFNNATLDFINDFDEHDMGLNIGDTPGKIDIDFNNKPVTVFLKDLSWGKNELVIYEKDGGKVVLIVDITGQGSIN